MDDQTINLLKRARGDDQEAAGILFERYREPLRRALRRMLGDDYRARVADSEDATHDAIFSALRDLQSFEYRGEGSFLAWLLKRAEHALLNRIKASNRKRRNPGAGKLRSLNEGIDPGAADQAAASEASVSEPVQRQEARDIIRGALEDLPDKERDIIMLRQFFEMDTAAICAELGLASTSAARNLYARAQARLAIVLQRRGYTGEQL